MKIFRNLIYIVLCSISFPVAFSQGTPAGFDSEIRTLITSLQTFWQSEFQKAGFTNYTPVPISSNWSTACGASPSNAMFCTLDRTITYDPVFLQELYQEIGDSSIYMILAHEYAHSVSFDLGYNLLQLEEELLADCLSAAFINHSGYVIVEEGDEDELYILLYFIADPDFVKRNPELVEHYEHGSAFERSDAWNEGWQGGFEACLKTAGSLSKRPTTIGSYQLRFLENATLEYCNDSHCQYDLGNGVKAQLGGRSVPTSNLVDDALSDWNRDIRPISDFEEITDKVSHLGGKTTAVEYEQPYNNTMIHGVVIMNFQDNGEGLVIDIFSNGPSSEAQDWEVLGQHATTILSNLKSF